MPLKIPNLDHIKQNNPLLGEALEALVNTVETLGQKSSMNPQGGTNSPDPHSAINVAAKNGVVHVSVVDNNPRTKNAHNFLEYSTDPNFSHETTQTVHMGVSRQTRIPTFMGDDKPLYFRSYAQYPDGERSSITYHGTPNAPIAVKDGAAVAGPDLPASTGSGTASTAGYGFGREAFVSNPATPGQPPKVFKE